MEPVEILDKVIENYESGRLRWRQYGPNDTKMGGLCVQQAIWAVAQSRGAQCGPFQPYVVVLKAIQDHVHVIAVPSWNDNPDLTFSDMLDTLKTVANGLRSNT